MRGLRLSPKAKADLDSIWGYTVETWGEAQAETYFLGLDHAMTLLRENPLLGSDASFIRDGYRKLPAGSHLLFYRMSTDAIDIIRILHKNMDAERWL